MAADLSSQHEPISELFARSRAENESQFRVSDDQVQFYQDHGYLSGVRVLSEQQVELSKL